jgi:putative dimethyl sulfoxide reductase chaperone
MTNLSNEWKETLTGELLLLSLLGRVIYNYPNERAWYQSLFEDDLFSEVPFASDQDETKTGLGLIQQWGKAGITDLAFENMQADYTRLFIGIGKVLVPPYESVYFNEDRLVFQERTLEVRSWYLRFGLEAEKKKQEPDDHIGLELLFLSHLASLGIQALEKEDQPRFSELLDAQREFLKTHPGTWALSWCGLVQKNAQMDFYKGIAHLTRGALFSLSDVLHVALAKDIAE